MISYTKVGVLIRSRGSSGYFWVFVGVFVVFFLGYGTVGGSDVCEFIWGDMGLS